MINVGIGPIELVIMLLTVALIVAGLSGVFGRRRKSATEDGNPTHPQLKKCPGCGAAVESTADNCAQCGLRLAQ